MRVEPRYLVKRLNTSCHTALNLAVEQGAAGRYYEIGVEHLLYTIVQIEDGDVAHILRFFGKEPPRLVASVERALQMMRTGNQGKPTFSGSLFGWMEGAWMSASLERQAVQIRSGDLFLEFLANVGRYTAEEFPELDGLDIAELRKNWDQILAGSKEALEVPTSSDAGVAAPGKASAPGREALDRFCISFTDKAKRGEIDPIFGRDREIRQMIDILARRRKNNPIAVGEAGVGKTALVEGLARAIVNGDVPAELAQTELLSLDMGLLKAGAGVKGELENRLKKVIAEVKSSPTPIIMFIDEAHTLVGGGGSDNEIPNLLKPALARGEFRTVAATTYSEFKKYFEKDPALERRFQPVHVNQPSVDDAILMLRGLRGVYETAHDVVIREEAVVAAAKLSDRYITGRQLPDKAVDLLDTAAARVRIEQDAPPAKVVALRSEHASLERQLDVIQRDIADAAAEDDGRVDELKGRMEAIVGELNTLEEQLTQEKEIIAEIKESQAVLRDEEAEADAKEAASAAITDARARLGALQGENPLVHYEVDVDAVGQVVSSWTGIPIGKMRSDSIETMLKLEDKLGERIKGQDQATSAVAEAVRMSHAGVRNPDTPIAVLLFVGPSGVGKTETALALADELYGGERSMTTINMSEFQEKHTVSRLIGSPPGYVGYGEGGVLTEAVRHKPYSVVLLDEVEKADLEVMNLFYQVFDKGMLSDGEGRLVNFRNTVVILTSNLATDKIMAMHEGGTKPPVESVVEAIWPELSGHFKPALLARMSVVPYRPMDPEILADIAKLKLGSLGKRLRNTHGLETTFEDSLIEHLVARCTEGDTGARALDHAMRGSLMPNLARALLEKMAEEEMPATLSVGLDDEGGWKFTFA
jgi:type VI secretion system protein VasG